MPILSFEETENRVLKFLNPSRDPTKWPSLEKELVALLPTRIKNPKADKFSRENLAEALGRPLSVLDKMLFLLKSPDVDFVRKVKLLRGGMVKPFYRQLKGPRAKAALVKSAKYLIRKGTQQLIDLEGEEEATQYLARIIYHLQKKRETT